VSAPNLFAVDWSKIPPPVDDGAANHLTATRLPELALLSTAGGLVSLAQLSGRSVVFAYPMTGQPGVALPDGWDEIPGARGCTPQSCGFRDHFTDLKAAGGNAVFGLSTQPRDYQQEAAQRLHLPFPLLSDWNLSLTTALKLLVLTVDGVTLLKRLAMVIDGGVISKVFYPVFPPDRNASDVVAWLAENPT
jgi:peroxiredoxin